jgi:nitroreductase
MTDRSAAITQTLEERIAWLRSLRQSRRFLDQTVPPDVLDELLEVARWTGSAKNTQPWQFIVVDDRDMLQQLAEQGAYSQFIAGAALAIVLVLDGNSPRSEAYDEGRVTERLMLAASVHDLGSGTGWFSTDEAQNGVRELLGIPDDKDVWSAVAFGYVDESAAQRASSVSGGRKPLAEIVSYGRYGEREK